MGLQNGKLVVTWYEGEQQPKDFIDTNSVNLEKSHDEGEQEPKDFIDTNSVNLEKSHDDVVDLECRYTYSSDEDTETEDA